jgi:hypothetical protein
MNGARPSSRHHLRLVPREPPPRPHRLDVRIHILDGRCPYGRAGPLRLSEIDLALLVETAERLEARPA